MPVACQWWWVGPIHTPGGNAALDLDPQVPHVLVLFPGQETPPKTGGPSEVHSAQRNVRHREPMSVIVPECTYLVGIYANVCIQYAGPSLLQRPVLCSACNMGKGPMHPSDCSHDNRRGAAWQYFLNIREQARTSSNISYLRLCGMRLACGCGARGCCGAPETWNLRIQRQTTHPYLFVVAVLR